LAFDEIIESVLAQQLVQAVGNSVVGTHIVGCRSRVRVPIAMRVL
jgi:hypothetical protein